MNQYIPLLAQILQTQIGNPSNYGSMGDSGSTSVVANQSSGLGSFGGDYSNALGSSPTGLFSGLLPGGGMSSEQSGALGGGMSGQVAGDNGIGGSSMGSGSGIMGALPGLLSMASKATGSGQSAAPMMAGHAHTGNDSIAQLMQMYGVPSGLLTTSVI